MTDLARSFDSSWQECLARPARRSALGHAVEVLKRWRWRARSRRELARLDSRMLHDIGVDLYDVMVETGKPFWRA